MNDRKLNFACSRIYNPVVELMVNSHQEARGWGVGGGGSNYLYLSRLVGKPTMWFPTRSDTNRPVKSQKRESKKLEISDLSRRGTVLSV